MLENKQITRANYRSYILILLLLISIDAKGENLVCTLNEAIKIARTQSVQALECRQSFISAYWAYRSYKASRLPSLYVYGNLMNFNRSLNLMQSYEDGHLQYVNSNSLQNSLGLQINQNITFTGGTLSVYTDLARIDQFDPDKTVTWYSQPVTISYYQPLFSYNQFKWDKLIEPKEFEKAKKEYIESMELISLETSITYNSLVLAYLNNKIAKENYDNTSQMLQIAREREKLGTISKDELLQLELRRLNDSIYINETIIYIRENQMALTSALGLDESIEIVPIITESLPNILLDYEDVLTKSLKNSSFSINNEISLLNAQASVAKAKATRGLSMTLNARFGLSQTSNNIKGAYHNLLDQEVVGLTFSIPIYDWGLGKGKVEEAKAVQEVVKAQVQQSENDYRREIYTAVSQFNKQSQQCSISKRAMEIAQERYSLVTTKFRNGNASVLELNTAQSDRSVAYQKYITDINEFWLLFYTIRKHTLYDYIEGVDIDIDFNEILNTK